MKRLQLLLLGSSLWATVALAEAPAPAGGALAALLGDMTGSFSSLEQAKQDPDNYREIELHMVPIWTDRPDGPWLYVEQAAATARDKPYRQRVYRLEAAEAGVLISRVYTLPEDPLRWAGQWKVEKPLADLKPEQLSERQGCEIELKRREDGSFVGSTRGRACPSDLRGASYATSEVTITHNVLESWDRGYDAEGKQVWGAEKGPYRFVKAASP